jgi:hypothetical protein
MKRYIQLAKHYAEYKKFCEVLEQVCLMNNTEYTMNAGYFYNPCVEQELAEYKLIYMLYDNPELAKLAISFGVDKYMNKRYPFAFAVIEALWTSVEEPMQFYMDHIYNRN